MSRVAVRSAEELEKLRISGQVTAEVLKKVLQNVKVGVSLTELDQLADKEIQLLGATASFKTVPGYFWATCLTINEEVVHGLPREIQLKKGDILGVDLGAVYSGWHTDAAWSVVVGDDPDSQKRRFLKTGEDVLRDAIACAVEGRRIGDISATIQQGIEKAGYSVVKSLAGHGVGRNGHEEPEIPTFGCLGTGVRLKEGMSLAIEVIYAAGDGDVYEKGDGWTISTVDGSLGGLFEMSVIVGKDRPEMLTDWRGTFTS